MRCAWCGVSDVPMPLCPLPPQRCPLCAVVAAPRQMVSYYNDLDVYITRGDLNAMYQVNPVLGERVCFETDGPVNATSFFPDLSTFSYTGSQTVNNVACYAYTYSFTQGAKVNTYSFFVDASSGAPVQYSWLGYDVLLGSHYDQYIIDYTNFQAGPASFANTTFDKPSIGCGAFGGDSFENPSVLLSHMFPGTYVAWRARRCSC